MSDLLSNCCAADFDTLGCEKEEGIWQEKCLNCGKLCEPIMFSDKDIANIHRCVKWNLAPIINEKEERCPTCGLKIAEQLKIDKPEKYYCTSCMVGSGVENVPENECDCDCHKTKKIETLQAFAVYKSDSVELAIVKQNRDKINQLVKAVNSLKGE